MLRKDIIIGYGGIVLALVLAGLFAPSDKEILGTICSSLGLLMTLLPLLYLLYRARRSVRIFSTDQETLDYVRKEIADVCDRGGTVFSTYILDDSNRTTDIVLAGLRDAKCPIQYHRLILIDDPEVELAWLSAFLSLNQCKNLTVSAHLVNNQGRLVSRFIRKAIPFINVFLVKNESSFSRSLFLLTLPKRGTSDNGDQYKFAVAIKNDELVRLASSYFDNLLASAGNLIREIRSIEQYKSWRTVSLSSPQTMSIVETVKECAESLPEIVHVGVFGSISHRLAGTYVDRFSKEHENDLDLIVILRETSDKNKIKLALSDAIKRAHSDCHIEWSNESPEFYWIREQYQIDIQIHFQHDSYYIDHPLLGCSIFANYYVLFSDAGRPVNELIGVPVQLLDQPARAKACLDDVKFGVRRFLQECASENPKIDPRRVISINTKNFAWATAGSQPQSGEQAFAYVARTLEHSMVDNLKGIMHRSTDEISQHQREDLKIVHKYLSYIVATLEKMSHA